MAARTCSSVRSTLNTLESPRCVLMLLTACFAEARTRIVQLLVYGFSASSGCTRLALAPALPGVAEAPTFLYKRAEKGVRDTDRQRAAAVIYARAIRQHPCALLARRYSNS